MAETTIATGVVLGRRELAVALTSLPGGVAKKVLDAWTLASARRMRDIARRMAPRDKGPRRGKTESERLWKTITASPVRKLGNFPNTASRSIAYGASTRKLGGAARGLARANARITKFNKRSPASKQRQLLTSIVKRGRHFHLAVLGTAERQTRSGKRTGKMWGKTSNPMFWQRATTIALAMAQGEVGSQLKTAYMKVMKSEVKRLAGKYNATTGGITYG